MKTYLPALAAVLLSSAALADTYHVTFGWVDGTAYVAGQDAVVYAAKYKINGGAEVPVNGLATPGGSFTATATPGQKIEIAGQATNKGLSSAWTAFATATAPYVATQPGAQTGLTVTVVRTGP